VSKRNFSFTIELPYSTFTFVHHIQTIIEEVYFDDEVPIVVVDMTMEVYNNPPPSQEYVRFLETTLLRTREALAEAFHDRVDAKREAKRWKVLRKHLFKKCVDALFDSSFDDEFGDKSFCKHEGEEEAAKQKGDKK